MLITDLIRVSDDTGATFISGAINGRVWLMPEGFRFYNCCDLTLNAGKTEATCNSEV